MAENTKVVIVGASTGRDRRYDFVDSKRINVK